LRTIGADAGGNATRVLRDLRGRLTDWQGLLRQEAPHGRHALSALLPGRLAFTLKGEGAGRHYEFAGPGSLSRVVTRLGRHFRHPVILRRTGRRVNEAH